MNSLNLYCVTDGYDYDWVAAKNEGQAFDLSLSAGCHCDGDRTTLSALCMTDENADTIRCQDDVNPELTVPLSEIMKHQKKPAVICSSQW